jgi:hypothetical protein
VIAVAATQVALEFLERRAHHVPVVDLETEAPDGIQPQSVDQVEIVFVERRGVARCRRTRQGPSAGG